MGEQRQHELGAGQRGRPQQQADLAAQAAAVDEHQALAALGELVGELHGDAAAQRVADDRRPLVAERDEQVAHAAGVGAERVVAAWLGRLAVAEQVGREHGEAIGQLRHDALPRRASVAVIPWTSTITGPSPAWR